MRHSICAPHGGFMNHFRWLMLLSQDYNNETFLNSESFILPNKKFPLSANDKVDFLLNYIYPQSRKFFNWLNFEYAFALKLHQVIYIHHRLSRLKQDNLKTDKVIILNAGANFLIDKFFKFNPIFILEFKNKNPINYSIKLFFDNITKDNNDCHLPESINVLKLNGEILYNELLDEEMYNDAITFFNISNEYYYANILHAAWFNLQTQAKKDCIDWVLNSTYNNFPWDHYYTKNYNNGKKLSEQDFNLIRNYLKEIYTNQNGENNVA